MANLIAWRQDEAMTDEKKRWHFFDEWKDGMWVPTSELCPKWVEDFPELARELEERRADLRARMAGVARG